MNENVSVISECDNLEIENYLKSCGSYPKCTEVKFVGNHGGGCCSGSQSSRDVGDLIQYSKSVLNKCRTELRDSEIPDIDKHIIIEKDRLNELLKLKIKEYIRENPLQDKSPSEQIQQHTKVVHFKEKPKPLVRNAKRIKSLDRHTHCFGNVKPAKPAFVSRKSQQIHVNKIKSLRIGRNIVVDPSPGTSYYPRRIFTDTKQESSEAVCPTTWHDRLLGITHNTTTSNDYTIMTATLTSQVIKKSEIKVLRYNFDWGGTDAASSNETTGGKKIHNIDQTTQTESNVVTTKSVECYTEELCAIDITPEVRKQPQIIAPNEIQVSSHETDDNVQVTVGSSFVYDYESTFDESSSDSELSETVRPTEKKVLPEPVTIQQPRKPNILLESVVYESEMSDQRDAGIQTESKLVHVILSPKNIQVRTVEDDVSHKDVELELSRLNKEIMQDKFKLLSVLRQSPHDIRRESISQHTEFNTSQPEVQLMLTPLKPRHAAEFIPSPLELSSIRPLALSHKNSTFDLSNEKYWKTINKIQMDAARKPFSPKTEANVVEKRAAEKFLKSTLINTDRADESIEPSLISSTTSSISNVVIITSTSSSEYESSDSTITKSHRNARLTKLTNTGKISDGEVLSLGEVRKSTDDSEY